MLTICGKCSLEVDQLIKLRNAGCSYFEIHLNPNMIEPSYLNDVLPKFAEVMYLSGMKCRAVHTPYEDSNKRLLSLGDSISSEVIINDLESIIRICNRVMDEKGFIIYHVGNNISFKDNVDLIRNNISEVRDSSVKEFKHTVNLISESLELNSKYFNLAIENVLPVDFRNGEFLYSVIGNGYDNYNLVREVRLEGNNRVYSLLDTCHFGASQFHMCDSISIGDVINRYSDNLGMLHISVGKGLTLSPSTHGQTFTRGDKNLLKDIIMSVNKIGRNIPLTIEVFEDDYINGDYPNYRSSLDLVKEIENDILNKPVLRLVR